MTSSDTQSFITALRSLEEERDGEPLAAISRFRACHDPARPGAQAL